MQEDVYSRQRFDEAAETLTEASRRAAAEEEIYRATDQAEGKNAANRLIESWEGIAAARRRISLLYEAAVDEAKRLNQELDERIKTFGPQSREVAEFRKQIKRIGDSRAEGGEEE